jgi:hypothetical protein
MQVIRGPRELYRYTYITANTAVWEGSYPCAMHPVLSVLYSSQKFMVVSGAVYSSLASLYATCLVYSPIGSLVHRS